MLTADGLRKQPLPGLVLIFLHCIERVVGIVDLQEVIAHFDNSLSSLLVSVQCLERCEIDLLIFEQMIIGDLLLWLLTVELLLENSDFVV